MICTTGSHFWLWSGAGSAPSAPDHIRCQCGQYTAREWRTLEAENARLTALLAERDAEIARLKLTTRSDREYAEQKQRAEEAEGEIARLREALEPYTSHRLSLLTTETANHVRATVAIDLMDKRQAVASLEAMRAYICQTVPSMLEALRKARAAFAARGGAS